LLKGTKGANQSAVFPLLIVHYIPEFIVHYMTECPRFSRRRRQKKLKKRKIRIKKIVHYIPESVVQYKPESIVHYIPEYSLNSKENTWMDELITRITLRFTSSYFRLLTLILYHHYLL